jgi:hypothetical protein
MISHQQQYQKTDAVVQVDMEEIYMITFANHATSLDALHVKSLLKFNPIMPLHYSLHNVHHVTLDITSTT